jgi:hypothetical protein
MMVCIEQICSLEDLCDYVNETLCDHHHLQIGAFQMTTRILIRGGKPCGIYFCLHGPRGVKFTAIWETDRNCVLFYGSNGERFQKTQLLGAPQLEPSQDWRLEIAAA